MEVIPSLLTLRSGNGAGEFVLICERFLHFLAVGMCLVTFGNILLGCFFSVHCSQILPTVSYLACYKGHERLTVLSFVLYGLCLAVLFLGMHVRLYEKATRFERYLLLFLGLCIVGTVPTVGIIDELNGLYFAPIDFVHGYALYTLIVCSACWLYLGFSCLYDLRACFSVKEMDDLHSFLMSIIWLAGLTLLTVVQWQVGYSIYSNFWFNENTFALCEWVTIAQAVFIPAKCARLFGDLKISLSVQDFCLKREDVVSPVPEKYYSLEE